MLAVGVELPWQLGRDPGKRDMPGNRILRFTAFLFGAVSYITFLVTILYAIGFVDGLVVPKTIDTGAESPALEAIAINLALMALFAVQHSVMAHLMTNHPTLGLVDVFATTIPTLAFMPGVHVNYAEAVLPMRDGLPS
jgi:hypothetical protein